MEFSEYQEESRKTAMYPKCYVEVHPQAIETSTTWIYPLIGLQGEVGEVAELFKKAIRDCNGVIDDKRMDKLVGELGDVLWYLTQIASELRLNMDDIAGDNLSKLNRRKERNLIHGDGDNR